MGIVGDLLGTPKEHEKEKAEHEVVKTPEFDITQYAKKLAVVLTTLAVAGAAALKGFDVDQTEGLVIAIFGVIAAALLGVSVVMAVDLAARAYLAGPAAAEKDAEKDDDAAPSSAEIAAAPSGTIVWLKDDDQPHPLLAIASSDGKTGSYLVAAGSKVSRAQGATSVDAIGGAPEWFTADSIRAVRPPKWP
jgi:hypothetical protein